MDHQITSILEKAIANRVLPGATVSYIANGHRQTVAVGTLTYDSNSPIVNSTTVYDTASITKSVPLALLANMAIEEGVLSLTTKLVDVLPDFIGKYHDQITIWNLLTYTAVWDFPDGMANVASQGAEALLNALHTYPLTAPAGQTYFYTNAPAVVLGMVLENIYKQPFYALAEEKILRPLRMAHSTFTPDPVDTDQIAPAEVVDTQILQGVVQDESARALQAAGYQPANAGLFSTAEDLLNVCEMILYPESHQPRLLSNAAITTMLEQQINLQNHTTRLGWETDQTIFRENTYRDPQIAGKTGFSGCVIAMHLNQKAAFVMLSNAKYPDRSTTRAQLDEIRADLAQTIFEA